LKYITLQQSQKNNKTVSAKTGWTRKSQAKTLMFATEKK